MRAKYACWRHTPDMVMSVLYTLPKATVQKVTPAPDHECEYRMITVSEPGVRLCNRVADTLVTGEEL